MLNKVRAMPKISFFPEQPCHPINTMSMAPATPSATPAMPRTDIFSPMKRAAHSMVATGVSVAMSEK